MRSRIATLTTAAVLALAGFAAANAQYPPPEDPITFSVSDPTPTVNETIIVEIAVSEEAASRIGDSDALFVSAMAPGAMSGASSAEFAVFECIADLSGGAEASVDPTRFSTDEHGRAQLSVHTGTQPGTLTLSVECDGLFGQVLIPVSADTGVPAPPATGTGSSNALTFGAIPLSLVGVSAGFALISLLLMFARRRNRMTET